MFWILYFSNKDRGFHIDVTTDNDKEYQALRIIGKDRRKCVG